jgi:hypothetical protein
MKRLTISLLLIGAILSACSHNPAEPPAGPTILSVIARPDTVGPSDSTVVTIIGHDPNGDALVYDWVTDARLIIQGTRPNQSWLYNTHSNVHTFYTGPDYRSPVDTAWVQCFVRDLKGGQDSRTINIYMHH